jgi:hypothetical protein
MVEWMGSRSTGPGEKDVIARPMVGVLRSGKDRGSRAARCRIRASPIDYLARTAARARRGEKA